MKPRGVVNIGGPTVDARHVSLLSSGHDAWVVGDESAIVVDFQGMIDYARSHTDSASAVSGRYAGRGYNRASRVGV